MIDKYTSYLLIMIAFAKYPTMFFFSTGDPFRFLTNYPPFAWAQKLPPCDCFRSMYRLGPIRWILSKIMGSTLLFTDRLRNKKAIFLPNQSKREQSSLPGPDGSRDHGDKTMIIDDEVIEAAKGLLLKRQESSLISDKLKQIEKSMLLMNKQQNLLIEMINNLKYSDK